MDIDNGHLLKDLTEAQLQAVRHVDGPLLIIAGAGSGKTRVITRRVGYLMSLGIVPASIMAITFTNKAAGEMKTRVGALDAMDGRKMRDFGRLDQPWPMICTFHSLCLRILRQYAQVVGLGDNFSIFDAGDQTKLIKEAMKLLEIPSTNFQPAAVHGTISNAKNQLLSPEQYAQGASDFYHKTVGRVYGKYQKLLTANNALDFDDLLLRTAEAFRDHPQILKELQDRFQYILIDEYQDTNHAQYIIAHALAQRGRNICVVGDPDQSIYRWRGADLRNILEFEQDYPDARVVKLEQNYRSTKTILQAASELIAHNRQRKDKRLWTENEQGQKVEVWLCQDEHDEAKLVAGRFKELHEQHGVQWNQMAVFYRINALSRVMEDALRRANMPYVMARGVEFYNRKVIKDVLAYLRVIANPSDEVSLTRIVNTPPRGIGDSSVKLMQARSVGEGISLWEAMERADQISALSTRAVKSTRQFVSLVESWRKMAQTGAVRAVMEDVIKRGGIEAAMGKADREEGDDPLANVNELISAAAEYEAENPEGTLQDYLSMISLVSDADHMKGTGGAITMMTLHAAKGLEFPAVAMIGLEEGILPHSRAREDNHELEEERRLCFVGITRAQRRLILSKAAYRTIRGLRERTIGSPFLNELPADCLEITDRTGLSMEDDRQEYRERYESESKRMAEKFQRGQLVRHPQFGMGRIDQIMEMGRHTRAVVQFNSAGRKTLILQYARLEPAEVK